MAKRLQTRQSTEVRRGQIADAAGALMVRHGGEHATIKGIAKEIGLSEGAVYRHFKRKDDILSLMVTHVEEALLEDIDRSFSSARTPFQVLENALRNHVANINHRRGVSFQIVAQIISIGDGRLKRQASDSLDRYTGRITDLLAAGIKAEEVREEVDPEAASLLVASMIQGLANSWSLSNYEFDLEERYERMWGILRRALIKEDLISHRRRRSLPQD